MKKVLTLALAGIMAMSLVACGDKTETPSTTAGNDTEATTAYEPKPCTLNVTTTWAGEEGNVDNYQQACKDWEAASGNKISDSSATANEEFKARVITDFETGSEPDVLFYFNGVDSNAFVEQGKVMSIDEIRAEYPDYASNMKDDMLGASPLDGVNYSIPMYGYWEGLFVNKEVLTACGVDVPTADTTWEQFLEMCETIKSKGYAPIAASLQEVPHYWFEYTIYNHQDWQTHNTLPASADDELGKQWVAGLMDIKDLYDKGYFPENTLTATDPETFQMFCEDKAAFLIDGSWKCGGIIEAVEDIENFTVTHVPGMGNRKSTDMIGGLSSGFYITKKAWEDPDKRAAAVDFVKFMTSDEMVSKFAGTAVTALKNPAKPDTSEMTSLQIDALAFTGGATGIAPAVQDNLSEAAREPIFAGMADVVKADEAGITALVQSVLDKNAE